jgi:hypothetical protein
VICLVIKLSKFLFANAHSVGSDLYTSVVVVVVFATVSMCILYANYCARKKATPKQISKIANKFIMQTKQFYIFLCAADCVSDVYYFFEKITGVQTKSFPTRLSIIINEEA